VLIVFDETLLANTIIAIFDKNQKRKTKKKNEKENKK